MNPRRWRRNVINAVLIAAALAAGYVISDLDRPLEAWSFATAYVGLGVLAVTLCLGPLNVLRDAPNPVSTHVRRDLGVWGALLGVTHTLLGLEVHKGGQLAGYFLLSRSERGLNTATAFIVTNYMGALAIVVLLLLLTLSNDYSLRRLGTRRWKQLQRWSYAVLVLVALHGAIYQVLEKRALEAVLLLAMLIGIVVYFQIRGFSLRQRRLPVGGPPRP
ncbi:MAG: ferric reductase-like transmembrane domain-containing protein [Gemmatimonadaceae bacterium]